MISDVDPLHPISFGHETNCKKRESKKNVTQIKVDPLTFNEQLKGNAGGPKEGGEVEELDD